MWMSHGTVISHIQISNLTHINKPCRIYKWAMSQAWMSHFANGNASCHTQWRRHCHTYTNSSIHKSYVWVKPHIEMMLSNVGFPLVSYSDTHAHAHTYAHTHAHIRTRTSRHTHYRHIHEYIHKHTLTIYGMLRRQLQWPCQDVYVHVHEYIHISVYIRIYMYIYITICIYIYIYTHICIYTYIYIYTYTWVAISRCIYTCI